MGLLLLIYLVWANIEQVESAHGAWATDFDDPRHLVGYADAVFLGRVVDQTGQVGHGRGEDEMVRTKYAVEVLQVIKSVRKLDPNSMESSAVVPAPLTGVVTVEQYGGHIRNTVGKRILLLMDEQPLLVPGDTYVIAASYDPQRNSYHVLPAGAALAGQAAAGVLERFERARSEEIPFDLGNGIDTPDPPRAR